MKEILTHCIKVYEDAIRFIENETDEEDIWWYLYKTELRYGLCHFVNNKFSKEESNQFEEIYISVEDRITYIWQSPSDYLLSQSTYGKRDFPTELLSKTCLQPRLDFLKEKLSELN